MHCFGQKRISAVDYDISSDGIKFMPSTLRELPPCPHMILDAAPVTDATLALMCADNSVHFVTIPATSDAVSVVECWRTAPTARITRCVKRCTVFSASLRVCDDGSVLVAAGVVTNDVNTMFDSQAL